MRSLEAAGQGGDNDSRPEPLQETPFRLGERRPIGLQNGGDVAREKVVRSSVTAFSYESAPILPLYYKRPLIDGRHVGLDLDPEDDGVTSARATTGDKEQRRRKLRTVGPPGSRSGVGACRGGQPRQVAVSGDNEP